MSDSFGKIIAIILVVMLMVIAPVRLLQVHQENTVKMYIYTEASALCERVRNTGKLSSDMYETLCRTILSISDNVDVQIWSMDEEGNIKSDEEIKGSLDMYDICTFKQGEFIRVKVMKKDTLMSYCGGMIKYYEDS